MIRKTDSFFDGKIKEEIEQNKNLEGYNHAKNNQHESQIKTDWIISIVDSTYGLWCKEY